MLFNSYEFIFLFLPVTLLLFYLLPSFLRVPILLLASSIFYGASGVVHLVFFYVSVIWGGIFAKFIDRRRSPYLLLAGISIPLAILYLFKYLGFTFDLLDASTEVRSGFSTITDIILPAGISFYTFKVISYVVDVYDRKVPADSSIFDLTTFILLFPQLIAGPILRFSEIKPQFEAMKNAKALKPDVRGAIKFISLGLFFKIFFADFITKPFERYSLESNQSAVDAIFSVLAFSFRIYYDFWAYSIIAIGLMKLLTIEIPKNFDEPYLALNPRDFWRRWHMSLSYWLRDYVYIKLGGKHHHVRNIILVFSAVGLWHGAGLNFVVWGLYHAALVLSYIYLLSPLWDRLPSPVQVALNFSLISLGWPLFYLDLGQFLQLMDRIFVSGTWTPIIYGPKQWLFLAMIALWTFCARERKWLYNSRPFPLIDSPFAQAVMAYLAILFFSWGETFIYFRF